MSTILWDVPNLVRANSVVVIYVGATAPPTEQVFTTLATSAGAATAWVASSDVFINMFTRDWIHARQRALGWAENEFVPDGYYLFIGGEVRAHHAGIIDTSRDGLFLLFGVLTGIDALFSKGKSFAEALAVAHAQAALRVIAAFWQVIAREGRVFEQAKAPPPPPAPPHDELVDAFAVLGLDPTASQDAVKRRYRELMKEHHPDRSTGNPDVVRVATERAQEINKAHGLILARRGWRPAAGATVEEAAGPPSGRPAPKAERSAPESAPRRRAAARRRAKPKPRGGR